MKRFRAFLRRLFDLPWPAAVGIAVPAFALLGVCLATGGDGPEDYLAYLLSAYALAVATVAAVRHWPKGRAALRRSKLASALLDNPLCALLRGDVVLRTRIALIFSTAINTLYAAAKLAMGVWSRSVWFTVLGVYYLTLGAMRYFILRGDRKSPIGVDPAADLRRCRMCGAVLLGLNVVLTAMVAMAVTSRGAFRYPGALIYVMAAYAFFAIIHASRQLFRARRWHSPLLSAAKAISFTAAMVSMLSLEIALTARFGPDDLRFARTMTAALGLVVCTLEFIVAITMIARSQAALRRLAASGVE